MSTIFIEDYKQTVWIACFYSSHDQKLTPVGGLGNGTIAGKTVLRMFIIWGKSYCHAPEV